MTHYDVFNGDADGICALHQLRLSDPKDSELVTGVKRDINLVKQIPVEGTKSVTVLDVSMDKNSEALQSLIAANIPVSYYDHHFPGDIPDAACLDAHIDTDANTCTGLIVNKQLNNAHLPWAVTAAFGDNLLVSAREAAKPLGLNEDQISQLQMLGTLLNYNGYGMTLDDLFFPPAELYKRVKPYSSPFDFIEQDDAFAQLKDGFEGDMQKAKDNKPVTADQSVAVFIFPEEAYARRVSGVYANDLAQQNPDRAHAMLSTLPGNGYLVSVRAPLSNKTGADELCRQFESGGGRKAAAGINFLPASDLDKFTEAFRAQFS